MAAIYTVKQVADMLGYSTNSIYSFLKEKRIKGVRVGKGRFRIPEQELARILHISKKTQEKHALEASAPTPVSGSYLTVPNIFHWFLGSASILVAGSMLLYNVYSDSVFSIHIIPLLIPIQTALFAGGMGMLISDCIESNRKVWKYLFQTLLCVAYGVLASMGFHIGDGGAMGLFGSTALFILFTLVFPKKGMLAFRMFVCLEIIVMSIVFLVDRSLMIIPQSFSKLNLSAESLGILWFASEVVYAIFVFWSWKKNRMVHWAIMMATGVLYVLAAGWYAQQVYWVKSMFTLMTGLTCFFVPSWDMLKAIRGDHTKLILSIYTTTIVFLCCFLALIGIMQKSVHEETTQNIAQVLRFGGNIVDTTLVSSAATLDNVAKNPLFIRSVMEKKTDDVIQTLRGAYEGNRLIRRFIVLSKNGDLIALYPHVELTEKNFSYRDYFKETVAQKSIYFSDMFQATDQTKMNVLIASIPFVDKGVVQGVLVGSIDLLRIDQQLQDIIKENGQEYFVVADKNVRYLIHKDTSRVGAEAPDTDFLHEVTGDDMFQKETFDSDGKRILVAGMKNKQYGWRLGLVQPMRSVLRMEITASLYIFYAVSVALFGVLVFIALREWGRYRDDRGAFHDGS